MFGVDSGPEIHTFSNSKTVEINHNLGFKPWVYIILNDDIQALSTVTHSSINSLTVTFQNSQSGSIYLR